MIKISNLNLEPIFEKERKGDVLYSQADLSQTHTQLDWKAKTKLEDGLKVLMN